MASLTRTLGVMLESIQVQIQHHVLRFHHSRCRAALLLQPEACLLIYFTRTPPLILPRLPEMRPPNLLQLQRGSKPPPPLCHNPLAILFQHWLRSRDQRLCLRADQRLQVLFWEQDPIWPCDLTIRGRTLDPLQQLRPSISGANSQKPTHDLCSSNNFSTPRRTAITTTIAVATTGTTSPSRRLAEST